MLIDVGFTSTIASINTAAVVARRNWRDLNVVVPVTLYGVANLLLQLGAITDEETGAAGRVGLALVVFLIMTIDGRIIPCFTRHWRAARRAVFVMHGPSRTVQVSPAGSP